MKKNLIFKAPLFAAVSFLLFVSAQAFASGWMHSSTGVYQGDTAQLYGGGFSPNSQVRLEITDPSEITSNVVAMADVNGEFVIDVNLDLVGVYEVSAEESAGLNTIVTTNILAQAVSED